VKPDEILQALRNFTERERIESCRLRRCKTCLRLRADCEYVLDLKNARSPNPPPKTFLRRFAKTFWAFSRPDKSVLRKASWISCCPSAWRVDAARTEAAVPARSPDALWRSDANPKNHVAQVKKYLRDTNI